MFSPSFTNPTTQNPQTLPTDPKANMPGFGFPQPQQQQPGFGFPQAQPQPSPYPSAPGFGFGAPQGGFGNMQNRPSPSMSRMQPMQFASGGEVQGNAQDVQQYGRGNDTMLMHVTPGEVQGLQALAQRHGGSLTTNPHTGLPEAGFLEDILPMLAGGALTFLSGGALTPLMSAALVGGGTGLATGDLGKGLMAGLGAFGGGSLGSALGGLGAGAAGATSGAVSATNPALAEAATNAIGSAATNTASTLGSQAIPGIAGNAAQAAGSAAAPAGGGLAHGVAAQLANPAALNPSMLGTFSGNAGALAGAPADIAANIAGGAQPGMLQQLLGQNMGDKVAGFGRDFAQAASGGAKISPMRTGLAALGASAPILQAMQPTYDTYKKEDDFNYEGPYTPTPRTPRFRGPNANFGDSSEFSYFDNTNPYPGFEPAPGYAEGGEVAPAADRSLRMPTADYRAGMGAEHNYNFRPISSTPGMPMGGAPSPMLGGGRQSFADRIALLKGRGSRGSEDSAVGAARRFRYDPQTQSVIDDGIYNNTGGMDGAGSLGGSSLFPSGVNVSRFAEGGDVNLRDGSFVVDARTVSELGNGSSGAGQELLARHGGQPIRGPGDGVSDSVPANIGGRQRAKVARDEVKFDPEAVQRLGGGDLQRGAKKLYALMEKAQKARKAAGRGQDTKLRKALSK